MYGMKTSFEEFFGMGSELDYYLNELGQDKKIYGLRNKCFEFEQNLTEVSIIYSRILANIIEWEKLVYIMNKKAIETFEKGNPQTAKEEMERFKILHREMILDFKCFYIFVRMLLDKIALILRCIFQKKAITLPTSLNKLLFKGFNKYKYLADGFFKDLKKNMIWCEDFINKRDLLVHTLEDDASKVNGASLKDFMKNKDSGVVDVHEAREILDGYLKNLAFSFKFLQDELPKLKETK